MREGRVEAEWFREAWVKKRAVVVELDERCVLAHLRGKVLYVATSGAFATVMHEGQKWHVPLDAVVAADFEANVRRRNARA